MWPARCPAEKSFQSPAELKTILKGDRDAFCQGLTEKMLTYAPGQGSGTL